MRTLLLQLLEVTRDTIRLLRYARPLLSQHCFNVNPHGALHLSEQEARTWLGQNHNEVLRCVHTALLLARDVNHLLHADVL